MARNYSEDTGVLVLKEVTPVIRALFQGFALNPLFPGKGRAFFARITGRIDPQWDDIHERLRELCVGLGIGAPSEDSIEDHLDLLATHFCVDADTDLDTLIDLTAFEGHAEPGVLFKIARHFDDGHGLTAMEIEGCWHCSEPRLFELGGYGEYYGRYFSASGYSSSVRSFGRELDTALETGDVEKATEALMAQIQGILAGVTSEGARAALREGIAKGLLGSRGTDSRTVSD